MASSASVRVAELDLEMEILGRGPRHQKALTFSRKSLNSRQKLLWKCTLRNNSHAHLKSPQEYLRWGPSTILKNSAGTCNAMYVYVGNLVWFLVPQLTLKPTVCHINLLLFFSCYERFSPHNAVDLPHPDRLQSPLFEFQPQSQTPRQPWIIWALFSESPLSFFFTVFEYFVIYLPP